MTSLADVLAGMKGVVVINERVTSLARDVEQLAGTVSEQEKRLIRAEEFINLVKPAVTRRLVGR